MTFLSKITQVREKYVELFIVIRQSALVYSYLKKALHKNLLEKKNS